MKITGFDSQTLEAGVTREILVDRNTIARNQREKTFDPPLTIHTKGEPGIRAHQVYIAGPSTMVYDPEQPSILGATCFLCTDATLVLWVYEVEMDESMVAALTPVTSEPKVELKTA